LKQEFEPIAPNPIIFLIGAGRCWYIAQTRSPERLAENEVLLNGKKVHVIVCIHEIVKPSGCWLIAVFFGAAFNRPSPAPLR